MNYQNLSVEKLFEKAKELSYESTYLWVSVIGWEDGDYFLELCKEDGGIQPKEADIFRSFFLGKKISFFELKKYILLYKKYSYISSKNGKYVYNFDLHIWSKNYYMIYNFALEKFFIKKMNFFDKIFKKGKQPDWQNEEIKKN